MLRHIQMPSVVVLLALGAGGPMTTVQAEDATRNGSAFLSSIHLSDAAMDLIDLPGRGVPMTRAGRTGTRIRTEGAVPLYRPPLRGAPERRIGGGSRGVDGRDWTVRVLAPRHTGLTNESAPNLYWFTSRAESGPQFEVTIIKQGALDPVLETTLQQPAAPGIQRLDLSRWGVELEPGAEYEWFVSVVRGPGQRSKDIVAGGAIRRVVPDPRVRARLTGADARRAPLIYAEQGIWYDAIDTLSKLIEVSPKDDTLRDQRAALLRQEGLEPAVGM